jgi:hypothetical protein
MKKQLREGDGNERKRRGNKKRQKKRILKMNLLCPNNSNH